MEFELINYSPSTERVIIPLQQNLERMGITLNIRTIDPTQYLNRLRDRDFDMISQGFAANADSRFRSPAAMAQRLYRFNL
ncbi:ABC transporter substrate-binding protein [Marispirochaeta aestuarii]|uniref:ABC transporter substrate-binding protein n=1 Tax=Marispirochaeta aestuarii TaxID=1963862 RepID=UPI0029C75BB0|nr:ABC transporter substrate-binding protein [Marispirochaeta aestuarii]